MKSHEQRDEWFRYLKENHNASEKSWTVTFWLSLTVGYMGIDRFYVGSPLLGILKLLSIGGFGIWWIADLVLLWFGLMRDVYDCPIKRVPKTRPQPSQPFIDIP